LGVIRFDPLSDATRQRLVAAFDGRYPSGDYLLDRELANLLLRLRAPNMVERLLTVLANAATQEEAIDAAVTLSAATEDWTMPQRVQLLDWFDRAATRGGGRSYFGYIVSARERFIRNLPLEDRAALQERIRKPLVENSPAVEVVTRPFVREWTLDELVAAAEADQSPRDLQNGRRMFSAATCYNCHRVAGEGSSVGPDLTGVGGRFGVRDILRSIVEPNYAISDQYQQMVFDTNGRTIVGRVTNLSESVVLVSTDMLDPKKEISIRRDEIDDQYPSDVSIMPAGLLNTLSEGEVLDLLAFLRNGGAGAAERVGATAPPASSESPPPAAAP
jgi:putative heme-binding domain-containing protein